MTNNYKLKAFSLLTLASLFLSAMPARAQAPANDDCTGAIVITPNTGFNCTVVTAGTTLGATESMEADPCGGNPDDDVWFKFTATAQLHKIHLRNITAVEGTSNDMYYQVLEGGCDGLTSVYCTDSDEDFVSGLTVGTEYYIRVYSYYDTSRQNFNICIGSPPAPPANDDCLAAVALTVNADYNCSVKTAGTTSGATLSMEADPCSGNPDDDVWYSFVATADTHRISLTNVNPVIGWSTDLYFQLFEGTTCDALSSVSCSDPESAIIEGLMPGATYYVRVYTYSGTSYQTFDICVGTPPPPPANDDCAGAVAVTVNPTLECTTATSGTTLSATESMQADCEGTADDDVWFKFTATGTSHVIRLRDVQSIIGWSTDMFFEVFEGTCDGLASIKCSDNDIAIVSDLTPNTEYFVRVYSFGDSSRQNFKICVATPPAAPANDDCTGATALTINPTLECTTVTSAYTTSATESMGSDPCSGNPDDDVWFTFTAETSSYRITLDNIQSVIGYAGDMYFEILEGTCDGLVSIMCSDEETNIVSDLNIDSVYYIRAYTYAEGSFGSFDLCISALPGAPVNDDCAGAVALTVNPGLECTVKTAGVTLSATESMSAGECDGNADDDVWYSFVATGPTHTMSLSEVEPVTGWSTYMITEVFEGTCDGLVPVLCTDSSSKTLENLTPGAVYYVRVYSYYEEQYNTFKICIGTMPPPPVNDVCTGAIAIIPGATFDTNDVVVSNMGATGSDNVDEPECGLYDGADVWYTVVVPASGNLTLETNNNGDENLTDACMAVYSGDCTVGFEEVDCDDDDSEDGAFSLIQLTNRTPGEVLYIRLWEYGSDTMGTFRLSAFDSSLSSQQFEANAFRHYPNPVQNVLNLSYVSEISSVAIYNMLGQQVLSKQINATETAVDMSSLTDGAYIVNITAGDTVKTIKVIKKQ